jgi:MYXO-CTERM domain-containing protein
VGQEITVTWIETVDHVGDFRISFAAKPPSEVLESDFETSPISVTFPDRQAGGPGSVTLTLPDTPCEECTIQVRQFMDGAMDPYYYTCASIRIESGSGTGGNGGGRGNGGEPGLGGDSSSPSTSVGGGEPTVAPPPPGDGCSTSPAIPQGGGLALAALGLVALRRRRAR